MVAFNFRSCYETAAGDAPMATKLLPLSGTSRNPTESFLVPENPLCFIGGPCWKL